MALIKQTPNQYSWIKYIKYRIIRNKNFLSGTYGTTGSGKSYVDLSVAEMLNPDFADHPERMCFSPLTLMVLINSGKLKRGDVIILEELGIQAGNRDWQSLFNKVIVQLLQTFRHLGLILLINVPYEDFIDVHVRKLMHGSWRTRTIDYSKSICTIKPQIVQYNDRTKKFYYKYLRIKKGKKIIVIKKWNIPKPSAKLVKIYEKHKTEFTTRLNKQLEGKLRKAEEKELGKKELTERQQEVYELIRQNKSAQEICNELGIVLSVFYVHRASIRKKGHEIPKIPRKLTSSDRFRYKISPESILT